MRPVDELIAEKGRTVEESRDLPDGETQATFDVKRGSPPRRTPSSRPTTSPGGTQHRPRFGAPVARRAGNYLSMPTTALLVRRLGLAARWISCSTPEYSPRTSQERKWTGR